MNPSARQSLSDEEIRTIIRSEVARQRERIRAEVAEEYRRSNNSFVSPSSNQHHSPPYSPLNTHVPSLPINVYNNARSSDDTHHSSPSLYNSSSSANTSRIPNIFAKFKNSKAKSTLSIVPKSVSTKLSQFSREVVLLNNPNQCKPLNVEELEEYEDAGAAFHDVTFMKEWSHSDLLAKIFDLFAHKLPSNSDYDLIFMRPLGDRLRKFYPEPGKEITGKLLFSYSKNIIYVRPTAPIPIPVRRKEKFDNLSDMDDSDDSDVFSAGTSTATTTTHSQRRKCPRGLVNDRNGATNNDAEESRNEVNILTPVQSSSAYGTATTATNSRRGEYLRDLTNYRNGARYNDDTEEAQNDYIEILTPAQSSSANSPSALVESLRTLYCETNDRKSIVINRETALNDLVQLLREETLHGFSLIRVSFRNEPATDLGGPTKEMFEIIFEELQKLLSEGDDRQKFLKFNWTAVLDRLYYYFGQIICLSLVNNGPYPNFFAAEFFSYLQGNIKSLTLSIESIGSPHVKAQLLLLREANSLIELNTAIAEGSIFEWAGVLQQSAQDIAANNGLHNLKEKLINNAIKFYVLERCGTCFSQLCDGLGPLMTHISDDVMRQIFTYTSPPLTARRISNFFVAMPTNDIETTALSHFERFLTLAESGFTDVTLQEIMMFATSSKTIPHTPARGSLRFQAGTLPRSQTCFNTLFIPTGHASFNSFRTMMETGIKCGQGFLLP